MELYIGNIPKGARPTELKKLIKESLRESVFSKLFDRMANTGQLDKGITVAIHKADNGTPNQENGGGGRQYRYGRVTVDSNKLGLLVMENIDGATLRGETLHARKIVQRRQGDRRVALEDFLIHESDDRRVEVEDRRGQ